MEQPKLGLTTPVKVDPKIYDGDTIKCTIERTLTIRILGDGFYFDTPEIKSNNENERQHAKQARDYLMSLLFNPDGTQKNIVIHINGNPEGIFANSFCIGTRAIAHVFADGIDVAEKMREQGYLKKEKYEETKKEGGTD